MLGKLIKHEFYATGRYFLPLYAFIVVLTPLFSLAIRLMRDNPEEYLSRSSVGLSLTQGILGATGVGGFIFMMLSIFIATFILVILRFYRTTATSEAYLTFTLPVKPWQILFSKTLSAFAWEIGSGIMALFAVIAMVCIAGFTSPSEIVNAMNTMCQSLFEYGFDSIGTMIILLFTMIFGILANIGTIYLAIMLGQLFPKNRVLISIGMYMAISVGLQFVTSIVTLPVIFGMSALAEEASSGTTFINLTYLLTCIMDIVIAAASLIVSGFIMKKKLNVQ